MDQPERTNCKGQHCRRAALWVALASTKRKLLVDADSHPRGTVRISDDGSAIVLNKKDSIAAREAGEPLYRIHAETCADENQFRGKGKAARKAGVVVDDPAVYCDHGVIVDRPPAFCERCSIDKIIDGILDADVAA